MSKQVTNRHENVAVNTRAAKRTSDCVTAEIISSIVAHEKGSLACMLQNISIELNNATTRNDIFTSVQPLQASRPEKRETGHRLPRLSGGSGAVNLTHDEHLKLHGDKQHGAQMQKKAAAEKRAQIAKRKEERKRNPEKNKRRDVTERTIENGIATFRKSKGFHENGDDIRKAFTS